MYKCYAISFRHVIEGHKLADAFYVTANSSTQFDLSTISSS